MKIVFLDVDGVLVHKGTFHRGRRDSGLWRHLGRIDQKCIHRLIHILRLSGARVVVSSSWRLHSDEMAALRKAFEMYQTPLGEETIVGVTGVAPVPRGLITDLPRPKEISQWLEDNGPVEAYVVIDDSPVPGHPQVRVDHGWERGGLQAFHVSAALQLLGWPPKNGESDEW